MSQQRPEGFARATRLPTSIQELDAELAARAAEQQTHFDDPTGENPLRAEQEHEALMQELHDPLGLGESRDVPPVDSAPVTDEPKPGFDSDEALRAREQRIAEILARGTATTQEAQTWPGASMQGAPSKRPPGGSGGGGLDGVSAQEVPSNVFARMRNRAHMVGRNRFTAKVRRHAGKLVFGTAFVLAIAAYAERSESFPEHYFGKNRSSVAMLDVREVFGPVREIARAPGLFARHGIAREMSGAYIEGALEAEILYLDRTFAAVTDPEARLAIVSVGIERAITMNDVPSLVDWLRRLDWIKDADRDARAAVLREQAYRKLAEVESAHRRDAETQKWLAAAEEEAKRKEKQGWKIRGHGWTRDLAEAMRKALESTQSLPAPRGSPPEYQRGYMDTLNEAAKAFNLLTHLASGPKPARTAQIH